MSERSIRTQHRCENETGSNGNLRHVRCHRIHVRGDQSPPGSKGFRVFRRISGDHRSQCRDSGFAGKERDSSHGSRDESGLWRCTVSSRRCRWCGREQGLEEVQEPTSLDQLSPGEERCRSLGNGDAAGTAAAVSGMRIRRRPYAEVFALRHLRRRGVASETRSFVELGSCSST